MTSHKNEPKRTKLGAMCIECSTSKTDEVHRRDSVHFFWPFGRANLQPGRHLSCVCRLFIIFINDSARRGCKVNQLALTRDAIQTDKSPLLRCTSLTSCTRSSSRQGVTQPQQGPRDDTLALSFPPLLLLILVLLVYYFFIVVGTL